MNNVINILLKFGYHLLFLVLEIGAIYLIVNYNQEQKEIFINTTSIAATAINGKLDKMTSYGNLRSDNDALRLQNKKLIEQIILSNIKTKSGGNDTLVLDSVAYEVIATTVCNSTFNLKNNNLTLCNGSDLGISNDMGVITDKGIIGVVRNVSPNYARVMSILNSQSIIDCAIRRNNAHGSLVWNGLDPKVLSLIDIPKHISVRKGDTIVTSGYSTIFPKGILVGTITSVALSDGSNSFNIDVTLFSDPVSVGTVYVIKNNYAEEQKLLEINTPQ
jgi:rod shape-determining protein MreC